MNAVSLFFFAVAVFFAAFASAVPVTKTETSSVKKFPETEEKLVELKSEYVPAEGKTRLRRATCDLLSVSTSFGSLNHAACAAHCLAMRRGFKGGRCVRGVCNCRK